MMDGVVVNLTTDSLCRVLVGFLRRRKCSSLVSSPVVFAMLQNEIMSFKGGEWAGKQER